jgi:hypothetical protein
MAGHPGIGSLFAGGLSASTRLFGKRNRLESLPALAWNSLTSDDR